MAVQVNIFEAGSVPTAQELVTLINELNTTLDESVTLTGEQSITGVKTFLGSKLLKFKQKTTADKLGFTFYDNQGKEVGNFEYDNKNNFRLLALGNYYSATNQEIEGHVGFKVYNKSALAAYRLLCPLAGNAKNSIPSLTDTYTNFYMPLIFTNGALSVTADNNGKVDLSTLIGSGGGGGDISGLATVATTGDYNDLLNLPTLFSGNYNDLTNKPALFSGDYADLTNKPTIPTNLSDLSDDSTHRLVTDALISTWNSKSDFSGSYNDLTDKPTIPNAQVNSDWSSSSGVSQILNKPNLATVATSGSYNDLTNKPTIPTVPTISTNITSDAASDTKTTSPKAVKDFVEGKGYLTQHQDISSKADQTDLEALEDRVETLEQSGSGGGTTQYSYLKLVPDLDAYTEAPVGEIVKYTGKTGKYTRGWDYEKVSSGSTPAVKILSEFNYRSISGSRLFYAYEYTEQVEGYFGFVYGTDKLPLLTFSKTLTAGDKVAYWNSDKTTVTIATISSVTSDGFFIDSNIYISLVDMMDCPISKYTCVGNSSHTCLVKGTTDELIIPEVALMHERFYFNNGSLIGHGQGSNNAFIYRETININIPANTAYIATINNASYQGPFYPTGKIGNQYFKILYYDDLDNCYACGFVARSWMLIGDDVFFGSQSGNKFIFNGNKTTIKSVSPNTRFNSGTSPSSSAISASSGYIEFVNANGDLIYVYHNILTDAPNTKTTFDVYVPSTGEAFTPTIETAITSNPVAISIGTPSVYWQPIIYPSAPVSSGN